jgi:hypothetical protein
MSTLNNKLANTVMAVETTMEDGSKRWIIDVYGIGDTPPVGMGILEVIAKDGTVIGEYDEFIYNRDCGRDSADGTTISVFRHEKPYQTTIIKYEPFNITLNLH